MKKARKKIASIRLEANCTVRDAAQLKDALLEMHATQSAVTVDVTAVERVETASLQILCAFVVGRRALGRTVRWQGESAALTQAAQLLGLAAVLDLNGALQPDAILSGAESGAQSGSPSDSLARVAS